MVPSRLRSLGAAAASAVILVSGLALPASPALAVAPAAAGATDAGAVTVSTSDCEARAEGLLCREHDSPFRGANHNPPSTARLIADLAAQDAPAAGLVPAQAATAGTPGIACDGNGVDGNRVQAVYAYRGTRDRYASVAPLIRKYAAQVDAVYRYSASAMGGSRRVRWATTSTCVLTVLKVKVGANPEYDMDSWEAQLAARGLNRTDRKYLVWMDQSAGYWCGLGDVWTSHNEKAPATNPNNRGASYAYVAAPCWGQSAYSGANGHESSEAHELGHMLGSVLTGAPHKTASGHCWDEWDLMCYHAGGDHAMRRLCGSMALNNRMDCHGDDYFNPKPKAGSWLASHWNVANSSFLIGADRGAPTISTPEFADGYLGYTITEDQIVLRVSAQVAADGGAWATVLDPGQEGFAAGDLSRGHTYAWRVRAMDSAGRWSAWAVSAPHLVPLDDVPVVTMGEPELQWFDTDTSTWTISFTWTSSDGDGYVSAEEVGLSDDDGATWSAIPGWDAGSVAGTAGHTYRIRVRAQDDAGQWSDWAVSDPVAIVADMAPQVTSVSVGAWDAGLAYVEYSAVDEGSVTPEVTVTDAATGDPVATDPDQGVPAVFAVADGHTYDVRVRVRDVGGQWSAPVTVLYDPAAGG
jgi:hypothetical protein